MSDYRPQQSELSYWRNVANSGRGSQMTACLHEACDCVARLESEHAEMAELLQAIQDNRHKCSIDNYAPGLDGFDDRLAALLERINK